MKKHLPNILLLIVVLANLFFIGSYVRNNGLGLFFSTTGIVFLVLGVFIFIFFLSIDPGYGWTKSIDLTKNYIMIFVSMAVSITGIVFIVTGQHINELQVQAENKQIRCQELIAGNAAEVLKKDWFSLRDQKKQDPLKVYLFQKKSDRNNYKIIATINNQNFPKVIRNLTISSRALPQPITVEENDTRCPGVFEKEISIDFDKHQKLKELVQFDLTVTISDSSVTESVSTKQEKIVRFTLQSRVPDTEQQAEPKAQIGTQAYGNEPDLDFPSLFLIQG